MYKVYVAGVNGAGEGEWQETQDRVTTQGLGRDARTPITHTHTHTHANTLGGCGATIMYNGYGAIMTVSGCLVMSWLQSPPTTVEGVWGWQWESLWEPLSVY